MANQYNCRIGKVTLKGGAELVVFKGGRELESERLAEEFRDAADEVFEDYGDDTGGFVILHWNTDGTWVSRFACGKVAGVGLNSLPEWAAAALRREIAEYDLRRSETEETGD
jgi:hypothetical protein